MNPEPMTQEWLRIVRYFKSKVRLRNRTSKRQQKAWDPTGSGMQKAAKEL